MKKFLILVFFCLLLYTVSALESTDVIYHLNVGYDPDCSTDCNNITLGNMTIQNCSTTCSGIIKILSGNDENHITILESLGTSEWTKDFTGYIEVELGNQSDITNLFDRLEECLNNEEELRVCLDSNRNVSIDLLTCKEDVGYKENYTSCSSSLTTIRNDKNNLQKRVEDLENEAKNELMWRFGIGIAVFFLGWKFGPHLFQGKSVRPYKDEGVQGGPSTGTY